MQASGWFAWELSRVILGNSFGFLTLNMSDFGYSYRTWVPQGGRAWFFGFDWSCKFDILPGSEGCGGSWGLGGAGASSSRLAQRCLSALHLDLRIRCPSSGVAAITSVTACRRWVPTLLGWMRNFSFGRRKGFFRTAESRVLIQAANVRELPVTVRADVWGYLWSSLQVSLLLCRFVFLKDCFLYKLIFFLQCI